ncbi:MAG: phosphatase PAP2 family protein [Paramuribaculum sp.]|nr:phosphatase PAP2 family protein [Paramuribaculum sp.]MDE6782674.1 phosphatase PAP2 family protein [Paramuribaculum sp.]
MLRNLIIAVIAVVSSLSGAVAQQSGYYLTIDQVPNSKDLLPPPPDTASARFAYDVEQYEWGKSLRDTPRGDLAADDAELGDAGLTAAFSEAFGIDITPENTPEVYRLITGMREDAGDLSTRHAKNYYMRTRPYIFFNEDTCVPDAQAGLAGNGSYPSGHTAKAWATALILAELNPARQDAILKRGFEMGQSRVICGYHFQSDVDAGRIVGSGVVARLHADDAFNRQLKKAKKEMTKLIKKGLVK